MRVLYIQIKQCKKKKTYRSAKSRLIHSMDERDDLVTMLPCAEHTDSELKSSIVGELVYHGYIPDSALDKDTFSFEEHGIRVIVTETLVDSLAQCEF